MTCSSSSLIDQTLTTFPERISREDIIHKDDQLICSTRKSHRLTIPSHIVFLKKLYHWDKVLQIYRDTRKAYGNFIKKISINYCTVWNTISIFPSCPYVSDLHVSDFGEWNNSKIWERRKILAISLEVNMWQLAYPKYMKFLLTIDSSFLKGSKSTILRPRLQYGQYCNFLGQSSCRYFSMFLMYWKWLKLAI